MIERERRGNGMESTSGQRPRVVILDPEAEATVTILDLPKSAGVGTSFRHLGRYWKVTALRSSSKVLIAEPT